VKVINLDSYKKQKQVILDGETYSLKGVTVGMYLDDSTIDSLQNGAGDAKVTIRKTIDLLLKISNIPEAVLKEQDFETLGMIMAVAQGVDPSTVNEAMAAGILEKN